MSASSGTNAIENVYPYLRTHDASAAIDFYKKAFGAVEDFRLTEPSGRVGHAELKFGEAVIMVSDEYPEFGIQAPTKDAPTGHAVHLHVQDVDQMANRAVAAGAELVLAPVDQFYGERTAKVVDPFGHEWLLGSQIEEVSREEMQRRFTDMCGGKEE